VAFGEAGIRPGKEGEPHAVDAHVECPDCGYDLYGLSDPRCPECGLPFSDHEAFQRRRRKASATLLALLVFGIGLNVVWFYHGEDPRRSLVPLAGLVFPYVLFLAGGAILFSPPGWSRRAAGLYAAVACGMVLWAAKHDTYVGGLMIQRSLEHGSLSWSFMVLGLCEAELGAIVWKRSQYSPSWMRSLIGTIVLAAATVPLGLIMQAWHYYRWYAAAHGLQAILLPPDRLHDFLQLNLFIAPFMIPVGILLSQLWGMPLTKPIAFGVLPPRRTRR